MSELEPLDPLSRELLDAARGGHAPPGGARDRVQSRVIARVGLAAFMGNTLAAAGLWLKIGVPIVLLALGGAAYFAVHRPAPAPVLVSDPPIASPAVTQDPVAVAPSMTATAPTERQAPSIKPHVDPPPSVAPPSIGEETALLMGAQTAIREGDSARALALLDEHARRFPTGMLAEERDASRVLALCAAGRTSEARELAGKFLAAHPRSPAASRVRNSCVGP
jgi:hypothetical protein